MSILECLSIETKNVVFLLGTQYLGISLAGCFTKVKAITQADAWGTVLMAVMWIIVATSIRYYTQSKNIMF